MSVGPHGDATVTQAVLMVRTIHAINSRGVPNVHCVAFEIFRWNRNSIFGESVSRASLTFIQWNNERS